MKVLSVVVKKLTSVTLPKNITSIGKTVFNGCEKLASITIPNSVTSIGESAFSFCYKLTNVSLSNSLTSIGDSAFLNCFKLTSITIPNSVTSIGDSAFQSCYILANVTLSNRLASIGTKAFQSCFNLASITIPNSVTSIGESAFNYCHKLIEVYNLSSSLEIEKGSDENGHVGYYAKAIHTNATDESILFNVGDYTFAYDGTTYYLVSYQGNDTKLTLPSNFVYKESTITSYEIYNYAFYEFADLTSVIIPNSVTSIGNSAFSYCYKLIEVYNLNSSLEIEKGKDISGSVGYYAKAIHTNATDESILFNAGDYTFAYDGETCYLYSYNGNGTKLTLPSSVDYKGKTITKYEIYQYSFENCPSLTSVIIPASVNAIRSYAFRDCINITSITIGENVINMDSSSLKNCDSIETGIIQSSEMANIVYSHKAGRLAEKATKIYIKSDITTIGSYITDNFDKASSTVEIEGISYYLYTLK